MTTVQIFSSARRALGPSSCVAFSAAAAFLFLWAPSALAYPQSLDSFGAYDLPTLNGPVQLVDQLNGNVVSQFPSEPSSDSADNPFANSGDISGGNPADAAGSTSYDGVHNTTDVTYSGDPISTGAASVHFGVDYGSANSISNLAPLSRYWADGTGSPLQQLPDVVGTPSPPILTSPTVRYVILNATLTSGSVSSTSWFEVPYVGSAGNPQIQLWTGPNVTLSNVGFQLSPTQIPLDNLNFGAEPPPGQPGTAFAPLPQYEGLQIPSSGSATLSLPEPGSLSLIVIGLTCAAAASGYRRWRSAS